MSGSEPMRRPSPWRRRTLLGGWLAASLVICARAAQVQVLEGSQWKEIAESEHRADKVVQAARGAIYDRNGNPLAVSREMFKVSVAPRELRSPAKDRRLLAAALGLAPAAVAHLTSTERRWSVVPGLYAPGVRDTLSGVSGIYLQRDLERYYPRGDLARGVLGVVREDSGEGGIEQWFNALLRGRPGREVVERDNLGDPIPGETYLVQPPVPGDQVVLTLDGDLQEIAQQALESAIEKTHARGGDVVVTDPNTGDILAMVSIADGRTGGLSSINTAYEPGSTVKPFTVAAILTHHVATLSDTVDVGNGTWDVAGRVLNDPERGLMTVASALRQSSDIGIAKAAEGLTLLPSGREPTDPRGLTPAEQYENLRDFGFGTPTGVRLPGEVGGILRRPDQWSAQSPVSLAIGYEIAVTPLQMAMAYGALANGGLLMEPRLVKEIRDPQGRVIERFEPRVVRRVVSEQVARTVTHAMISVVQDGTGQAARLADFQLAGKTGTSRAYSPHGGYRAGHYFASFVGIFPASAPQLVVYVKVVDPKGAYFGGDAAAPVTRATVEAVLATRRAPLDRAALLRAERGPAVDVVPAPPVRFAEEAIDPPLPPEVALPAPGDRSRVTEGVPIPEVSGLPLRIAVRRLHEIGVQVADPGLGAIVGTVPTAGTPVMPGDTVRLRIRARTDG